MTDANSREIAFEIETTVVEQHLILCFGFQQLQPVQDGIEFISMTFADEFGQQMTFEIADATAGLTRAGRFAVADLLPALNLTPFFRVRIAMPKPFLMFGRVRGFLIFPHVLIEHHHAEIVGERGQDAQRTFQWRQLL